MSQRALACVSYEHVIAMWMQSCWKRLNRLRKAHLNKVHDVDAVHGPPAACAESRPLCLAWRMVSTWQGPTERWDQKIPVPPDEVVKGPSLQDGPGHVLLFATGGWKTDGGMA